MNKPDQIIYHMQNAATLGIGFTLHPMEAEELTEEYTRLQKTLENERQVRQQTEAVLEQVGSKLTEELQELNRLREMNLRLLEDACRVNQLLLKLGVIAR